MPISTKCPSCNHKLRAPDNLLGKIVRCPACREKFKVDEGADEPPAETAVTSRPAKSKAPPPPDEDESPRRRRRNEKAAEDDEDKYEDEDDERTRKRKRRKARRAAAASAVAGPAIALMIVGGLAVLLSALSLALNLVGAAFLAVPQVQAGGQGAGDAIANAAGGIGGAIFGLCWGGIVASGAFNMYRLSGYGLAMTASIFAMLPCNLCCLFGLPFGIWALIALNRPDVKDAFR